MARHVEHNALRRLGHHVRATPEAHHSSTVQAWRLGRPSGPCGPPRPAPLLQPQTHALGPINKLRHFHPEVPLQYTCCCHLHHVPQSPLPLPSLQLLAPSPPPPMHSPARGTVEDASPTRAPFTLPRCPGAQEEPPTPDLPAGPLGWVLAQLHPLLRDPWPAPSCPAEPPACPGAAS